MLFLNTFLIFLTSKFLHLCLTPVTLKRCTSDKGSNIFQ